MAKPTFEDENVLFLIFSGLCYGYFAMERYEECLKLCKKCEQLSVHAFNFVFDRDSWMRKVQPYKLFCYFRLGEFQQVASEVDVLLKTKKLLPFEKIPIIVLSSMSNFMLKDYKGALVSGRNARRVMKQLETFKWNQHDISPLLFEIICTSLLELGQINQGLQWVREALNYFDNIGAPTMIQAQILRIIKLQQKDFEYFQFDRPLPLFLASRFGFYDTVLDRVLALQNPFAALCYLQEKTTEVDLILIRHQLFCNPDIMLLQYNVPFAAISHYTFIIRYWKRWRRFSEYFTLEKPLSLSRSEDVLPFNKLHDSADPRTNTSRNATAEEMPKIIENTSITTKSLTSKEDPELMENTSSIMRNVCTGTVPVLYSPKTKTYASMIQEFELNNVMSHLHRISLYSSEDSRHDRVAKDKVSLLWCVVFFYSFVFAALRVVFIVFPKLLLRHIYHNFRHYLFLWRFCFMPALMFLFGIAMSSWLKIIFNTLIILLSSHRRF